MALKKTLAAQRSQQIDAQKAFEVAGFPKLPVIDESRVHLGAQAPMFPSVDGEIARVKMGAQSPTFAIADAGLVRLGAQSPLI